MSSGQYSVLFVCTANRIRSVMAQALLSEQIRAGNSMGDWQIGSAGTWAAAGLPPMPKAIQAMAERGIDISEHCSQPVDQLQLASYKLILVMESGHQESLRVEFPEVAERIRLMSEMAGNAYEIQDPVSGTLQDYRHTAEILEEILEDGLDRIQKLAWAASDRAGMTE